MTREEAINVMQKYTDTESGIGKVVAEAHEMAIKALEQEPKTDVLDKIREEISETMDMEPAWKGQDNYIGGLQIACSIIDKYRQEDK